MAIPAAHELHRNGFEIDWVCGVQVLPLLQQYSWIRTIVADDRALLRGSPPRKTLALISLWGNVMSQSYDLCATLYYDARYRILSLPVRAKRKVSLSHVDRDRRLLPGRHHTDEYARILLQELDSYRPQSLSPVRPDRLPQLRPESRQERNRVALVPGGASNMLRQQMLRRWPAESYAELAGRLLARGDEVLLVGGPDDEWVRPLFQGMPVMDMIGTLSLPQVITTFDSCDVVVSHDTGPLHLAGLSCAALVGIFGPTNPSNFLPRRKGVRGIWGGEAFACRPCHDGVDFAPCRNNGCVQEVTSAIVLAQVDSLLRECRDGAHSDWKILLPSQIRADATA